MIKADTITVCYRMSRDKIKSIKEYLVALVKRKLQYDEFLALDDVSFHIKKGEVVGIIGNNGAGKSTLLKVISGILRPTKGSVELGGNVVPMLELGSGFDFDLTGRENIFLNGSILGYSEKFLISKYDEIVAFSELEEFIDIPVRNYSSGMIMRLAFSIASSIVPTLRNACSGYSSISPLRIILNPRIVSLNGTITPGRPVNCSATWNG